MSLAATKYDPGIIAMLQQGAIGFMPADTIYGLSCSINFESAVETIYDLKNRDREKPCIVLISKPEHLDLLGIGIDQLRAIQKHWPAPLTVVCEVHNSCPFYLHRGTFTLAVRMPNYPDLIEVIDQTGPLLSTSANIEGYAPVGSADEAWQLFGDGLDFYVDVGPIEGQASTVVRVHEGKVFVLRAGAFTVPGMQN